MMTLLLVGGGGHCRSCIDVIETQGYFQIVGIVRPHAEGVEPVLGYPILGDDHDLPSLLEQYPNALITIGQIKTAAIRIRIFELLKTLGAQLPVVVSPSAHISRHAFVAEGTIVMHGAIVNAGASVGANSIVNNQALVEHDVRIEDHCHISTGARVNGSAVIGAGCFVGSGAIVREGVRIGRHSIIGAGRVVLRDVPPEAVLRGDP